MRGAVRGRSPTVLLSLARSAALVVIGAPLATLALGALGERSRFPGLLPSGRPSAPWATLLHPASGIAAAAATSVGLAAVVTLVAVTLALPAAWALAGLIRAGGGPSGAKGGVGARARSRADERKGRIRDAPTPFGQRAWSLAMPALLAPVAAPAFAIGFGLHAAYARIGIGTGVAGVALGLLVLTLPYAVFILAAAFRRLDPGWADQARTLGIGPATVARHVTLPLIRPSIGAAAAVVFVVAWGDYAITLLLGGGRVVTLPMHTFALALGGARAVSAALAVLYTLPPLLVLVAFGWLGARGKRP